MSRLTTIGVALAVLLAIGAGGYYWRFARPIEVRTAVPEQNVEVRVFGIGTVEAQVLSKIGFQVAGKLASLRVDQGDVVREGELLAQLDDAAQQKRVQKSDATRRQAEANLTKIKAQRDRAEAVYQQKKSVNARRQTLAGRGSVSVEAAEDAHAAEAIAYSDVKVVDAEAAIAAVVQDDATAQHRLDSVVLKQHDLRAPFDARVIVRHKELGSVASTGEPVFTLIAPQSIWIRAHVDESLAGGLRLGQTAFVRLRSEMEHVVETEVVRIDQENDRATEERRVYVRCRVCSSSHELRFLGEQAEIEIVKAVIPRGVFVPLRRIEGYDGRSGTIWVIARRTTRPNARAARRATARRPHSGRLRIAGGYGRRHRRAAGPARTPRCARPHHQRAVT